MTITRTHLSNIDENKMEILRHIAWGEYDDLSMSENDLECIKVVVGRFDDFFKDNGQEYNDILGVIKNNIKNMEEGREVASFFESIMRDLTKGRSKLVMGVKDTIDKLHKSVTDAGVTEDYDDVDAGQITVVSAITSALTMYFDDVEDVPEQITLTADDVIGIAADSSDKYKEEVEDESEQEEEPVVVETVMNSKEIAQAVIATGILDKTIEEMSKSSGMTKMEIAELLVDVYEVLFNNIDDVSNNQKEVVFQVGKILINRCSTADQMEKLNVVEVDKMVDLMLDDSKLDDVDPQVAAALEKLGNALESNKEETDEISGGKFEAIKKKAAAFNEEQKALTVKPVEEKKEEPSTKDMSDAQLFRKVLVDMCDKYRPKQVKPLEECGKHLGAICLM